MVVEPRPGRNPSQLSQASPGPVRGLQSPVSLVQPRLMPATDLLNIVHELHTKYSHSRFALRCLLFLGKILFSVGLVFKHYLLFPRPRWHLNYDKLINKLNNIHVHEFHKIQMLGLSNWVVGTIILKPLGRKETWGDGLSSQIQGSVWGLLWQTIAEDVTRSHPLNCTIIAPERC